MSERKFRRLNSGRMSYSEREDFFTELMNESDDDEEPFEADNSDNSDDPSYVPQRDLNAVRNIECECFTFFFFTSDVLSIVCV